MNLTEYGYLPTQLDDNTLPARVVAVHKERYELVCEHGHTYGRLKTVIYFNDNKEAFPTTGDFVAISYNPNGDSLIVKTLPRTSFFSRRDPTPGRGEQAVAANFDYIFIMQSLNQDFNPKRLERYLTLGWQSGAIPVVLLTKADLVEEYSAMKREVEQLATGVAVFAVSAKTRFGLDTLGDFLKPGKTIVLLGSSGVGKSSLLNAIAQKEIMMVQEIREDDAKGRHTTTHRQLLHLSNGVMIIDTPGMRELGMWDVSSGLGEAFVDVEEIAENCRFADCRHQNEPGCAVQAAILSGTLSPSRLENYRKLRREAKFSEKKSAAAYRKQERYSDQNKKQKNRNCSSVEDYE